MAPSPPVVFPFHTSGSLVCGSTFFPAGHPTIFPPYFVAGAVFSGFAMVMSWMIPARRFLGLKHVVTMKHRENMNKSMLVTGMMVTYGYVMEHFIAWYSADPYEYAQFFYTRMRGPMKFIYMTMSFCNTVVPPRRSPFSSLVNTSISQRRAYKASNSAAG